MGSKSEERVFFFRTLVCKHRILSCYPNLEKDSLNIIMKLSRHFPGEFVKSYAMLAHPPAVAALPFHSTGIFRQALI
jgi:hypothetical protein